MDVHKIDDLYQRLKEEYLKPIAQINHVSLNFDLSFYTWIISEDEVLRTIYRRHEQLGSPIGWDIYLVDKDYIENKRRTLFDELPLEKIVKYAPAAKAFVERILEDYNTTENE